MIKTERARKYKSTSMLLPVVKMIFPIWATLQLFYNMLFVILSGHDQIKLSIFELYVQTANTLPWNFMRNH